MAAATHDGGSPGKSAGVSPSGAAAAPDAIADRFMIATRRVHGRPARLPVAGKIMADLRKNRGELKATSTAVMPSLFRLSVGLRAIATAHDEIAPLPFDIENLGRCKCRHRAKCRCGDMRVCRVAKSCRGQIDSAAR
jgi:hypothetical protein